MKDRKFISFLIVLTILLPQIFFPARTKAQREIRSDKPLTATKVEVRVGDEGLSVYNEDLNRYVIGTKGWVEYKITVRERVIGGDKTARVNLNPKVSEYSQEAHAYFDRIEGNNTIVFRFTPKHSTATGDITLSRTVDMTYGVIYFIDKNEDGEEVQKIVMSIDLSNVSTMPRVYIKNSDLNTKYLLLQKI